MISPHSIAFSRCLPERQEGIGNVEELELDEDHDVISDGLSEDYSCSASSCCSSVTPSSFDCCHAGGGTLTGNCTSSRPSPSPLDIMSSNSLHPAIQVDSEAQSMSASSGAAPPPAASASTSSRARSTSRGRTASNEASNAEASGSGSHARSSGSTGGGLPNIPLPSPSAVHINQSLEDSLRRGEEERLRRSAERRERRRRRIEQSKIKHGNGSATSRNKEREVPILEDPLELSTTANDNTVTTPAALGDASVDSLNDESALITSPILGSNEQQQQQQEEEDNNNQAEVPSTSSDDQGPYYREGYGDADGYYDDSELEDYDGRSLTRQLAETAVSVREMSRELGRARVKSNVQSVLIVTKARDNQLIKLTREIALYLMKTPRYGRNRGIVVYVDSQLKTSKRFDAAGIERDNPHLFRSESRHHHHHGHHHHHHSHHTRDPSSQTGQQQSNTASGSGTPRRTSSRRASNNNSSQSSLNLFGMTRAVDISGTASLSTSDRPTYLSGHSAQTSGANTPAPGYPKPMTKLTEALVTRQIDRQLEKENARRQSQGAAGAQGLNGTADLGRPSSQRVAFSTTGPSSETGTNAGGSSGDEQSGLLRYWTAEMCSKSPQLFDLVLTLGGDGTVLFTSWLFQHVVPPVIPFALGSLGFLTNFDFSDYKSVLEMAINEGVRVNLRMRFTATIYRAVPPEEHNELTDKRTRVIRSGETGQLYLETAEPGSWTKLESNSHHGPGTGGGGGAARQCKDREVRCAITRPVESFEVLNDLVVDRGPSPYVSLLELFGDEHHLTTVQADGLCVATPTGSTAYSLSAGGSLVHPEIPTLLITPICPHTLSFRPMLLPDSMELRIAVPYNSRSTAWASFDGRGRVELRQGDHIKVTASTYPFPTVCADKQSTDWFQAITRTLKWNERQRQKSFVVLEHDRTEPHDSARSKARAEEGNKASTSNAARVPSDAAPQTANPNAQHVDQEEEDEDDGRFDIDDLSSSTPLSTSVSDADTQTGRTGGSVSFAFSGAQGSNKWQPGSPVIMPPSNNASGFKRADGPQSPSEHDVSHSSANHLRQYATYSNKDSHNGSSSSRDRTPRGGPESNSSSSRTPLSFSSAAESSRPRSRNSTRRSHRIHGKTGADRVKAFVVFGADSSDFDTSSSGDDSDDTMVRPGNRT